MLPGTAETLLIPSTSEVTAKGFPFVQGRRRSSDRRDKNSTVGPMPVPRLLLEFLALATGGNTFGLSSSYVFSITVGATKSANSDWLCRDLSRRYPKNGPSRCMETAAVACFGHVSDVVRGLCGWMDVPECFGQGNHIVTERSYRTRACRQGYRLKLKPPNPGSSSRSVLFPFRRHTDEGFEDMRATGAEP
jgi:hypothetical protein